MFEQSFSRLLTCIKKDPHCHDIQCKAYSGIHFLYIQGGPASDQSDILALLHRCAKRVTAQNDLNFRCQFVRRSQSALIFRFQFLVPHEKSFCCGNECVDCVLYRLHRK